ncbi:hypothetical protein DID75_01470 [Candidatus Marinamargulisbacteria bacterium SCGC AG-410-N11]|nr:hypothetical protein DID75_01470 [Candidatus Marinamargulisbacteria bacterium SCGC AG-410-N11]
MIYSLLILYFIAISVGSCSFLLCWITNRVYRLPVIRAHFILFLMLTIILFVDISMIVFSWIENQSEWYIWASVLLNFILNIAQCGIVYAIPQFYLRLTDNIYRNIVEKVTYYLMAIFIGCITIIYLIKGSHIRMMSSIFFWVLDTIILIEIVLAVYVCIIAIKRTQEGLLRRIIKANSILLPMVTVGIFLDLFRDKISFLNLESLGSFRFYTVFYIIWSMVFVWYTLQILLKKLPRNQANKTRELIVKHNITSREEEVVMNMAMGLSNKLIAKKLYISISTVKRHIQNIYEKTGVNNRMLLMKKFEINALNELPILKSPEIKAG